MLGLPAVLAVALVRPVIGIRSQFVTLPLGFSGALAGLVGAETLRLDSGIRQHETPAMGTSNGAVHGFLLREAGHRKKTAFAGRIRTTTQRRCGRKYLL